MILYMMHDCDSQSWVTIHTHNSWGGNQSTRHTVNSTEAPEADGNICATIIGSWLNDRYIKRW